MSKSLKIIQYPNPILKKRAKEIKEITEEVRRLGYDMITTMQVNAGVGLAGNQVGVLQRIAVVQTENGPEVFINPVITKMNRKKETDTEGCLSIPDLSLEVKRAVEVEISALNMSGQKINIKAKGLIARIFQHEIDHLNGILIIDRAGFWQRLKIKKRLVRYGAR